MSNWVTFSFFVLSIYLSNSVIKKHGFRAFDCSVIRPCVCLSILFVCLFGHMSQLYVVCMCVRPNLFICIFIYASVPSCSFGCSYMHPYPVVHLVVCMCICPHLFAHGRDILSFFCFSFFLQFSLHLAD